MARPTAQHSDLRKAGLAAALVVGLILTAGLAVVIFTRKHTVNHTAKTPADAPHPEIPPDVADTGLQTGNARVQFADKKDPSRAAGMIEWSKLEPISAIEKRLTDPRGYIYMRDGGLVVVTSRTGRLNTTPKVQEPQSGRFEGGVTLNLFPAGTDPKTDKPTLTATSDSLDFDLPSASVSTTGEFTIKSTSFDIEGSGMRVIANQLEEGIERFEVAHVKNVVIRPDAKDPIPPGPLANTQPGRAAADKPKGLDHLRTYHAAVQGAVHLVQGKRIMNADRADAWAHVVNNRLETGAIGRFGPDPAASPFGADKSAAPSSPLTKPTDSTITGNWTGPLLVTPVLAAGEDAQPPEFKDNKVALRLQADKNPVTLIDGDMNGIVKAARLDLGATNRDLNIFGSPALPVQIDTTGTGSITCTSAAVDLAKGKIDLTGPGELNPAASVLAKSSTSTPAGAKPPASSQPVATRLTFAHSLALQFATAGDWITPDARTATINGGFTAVSGEVNAAADQATIAFLPRVHEKSELDTILLKGHAIASAPASARAIPGASIPAAPKPATAQGRDTLQGQEMLFVFRADPNTGEEVPRSVTVTGDAQATAGGAGEQGLNLKARTITAQLEKQKEQTVVTSTDADEEVHVTTNPAIPANALLASAEHLHVDPTAGTAVLTGKQVPVTISANGAVMMGPKITITQATGDVVVDGAGRISSLKDGDPLKKEEPSSSLATWTKSMTFNNATGKAVCVGDASATMTQGDTQRDVASAEMVILNFTPGPKPNDPKPAPGTPAPQRELLSAEAIGQLGIDGQIPRRATLEHRQFSVANGEQKLEQLVYLEGQHILADQLKKTLDVPVSGKLLVDDRTPEPAKPLTAPVTPKPPVTPNGPANPLGGFTSSKGTSLFTWQESLHLDMTKGEAVLKKDVALTHQPIALPGQPQTPQTTLDCDQLTAFLKTASPATSTPAAPNALTKLNATLERVEAVGNVTTKSEGKQLTADTLTFDTIRQFMEASGSKGPDQTLVTYLDPSRPAPLRARKITWDQKNGEVRIIEPAPTSIGQ